MLKNKIRWFIGLLVGLLVVVGFSVNASSPGSALLGGLMDRDGAMAYLTFQDEVGMFITFVYPNAGGNYSDVVAGGYARLRPESVVLLGCEANVGIVVEWTDTETTWVEHYTWTAPEGTRFPCGGEGSMFFLPVISNP